ncbi:ankyrin repeat-containing domain protein, partial [Colletotrichum navitas]
MLFKHGAVLNCKDTIGETPLFSAVRRSVGPIFNHLLELGADVSATDTRGQTALFALSTTGYSLYLADKGPRLLQKGLDPMHRDNLGQTFLHVACQSAEVCRLYLDFVREAVKFGLDVDALDGSGRTPLMNAARSGNQDFVLFLLTLGVDANKVDRDGRTPLTEAIRSCNGRSDGHDTVVHRFLEYGVKPHASSEAEHNPLFLAVEIAPHYVVEQLLGHIDIGI